MQSSGASTQRLKLPLELAEHNFRSVEGREPRAQIELVVPSNYAELIRAPYLDGEVYAIQRLLSIARSGASLKFLWSSVISERLVENVQLEPLLAVAVLLEGVTHEFEGTSAGATDASLKAARQAVLKRKLFRDMFAPSQLVVCADSRGQGRPDQLYSPDTGTLRPRSDIETLVQELLSQELNSSSDMVKLMEWSNGLGVVVAELFENTDMHAMADLAGARFSTNAIRGLMFKRIQLTVELRGADNKPRPVQKDALEISVFDTGVGYLRSFTKSNDTVNIDYEWKVVHKCLERHYADDEIPDSRPAHRALGLAEVLKAIQKMKGRIEIRTGRTFAYRTFVDGQLQAQMKPVASPWAHIRWPRPKMLDFEKRVVSVPTEHDDVVGSAVRVVIPLN